MALNLPHLTENTRKQPHPADKNRALFYAVEFGWRQNCQGSARLAEAAIRAASFDNGWNKPMTLDAADSIREWYKQHTSNTLFPPPPPADGGAGDDDDGGGGDDDDGDDDDDAPLDEVELLSMLPKVKRWVYTQEQKKAMLALLAKVSGNKALALRVIVKKSGYEKVEYANLLRWLRDGTSTKKRTGRRVNASACACGSTSSSVRGPRRAGAKSSSRGTAAGLTRSPPSRPSLTSGASPRRRSLST